MVKIAYLILCHNMPDDVLEKARAFIDAGDCVVIHFDKRARKQDFARLRAALGGCVQAAFAPRVACGWGEWSLVQATLNLIETARKAFPDVTHYSLISGDCYPIKSAEDIRAALAEGAHDYIETKDFFDSGWIKTGLKEDRLHYRHVFNERTEKKAFYASLNVQRKLGLSRRLPKNLQVKIGSQWWLLRAGTVHRVMAHLKERPGLIRFFRTTWIPDEIFFQSVVAAVTPDDEIISAPPTLLVFSDYGIPVVYTADHYEHLIGQRRFFARKITTHDQEFRRKLLSLYVSGVRSDAHGADGVRTYHYLAGRGRIGARFAPRFWERRTDEGPQRILHVVLCKDWAEGQAAAERFAATRDMPNVGYVFDDPAPIDHDLGNFQHGLEKRWRHRRAFLSLLFRAFDTTRMVMCLDPCRTEILEDLRQDGVALRALELQTETTDDFLIGHAARVGLLTHEDAREAGAVLIGPLRREFEAESRALGDLGLPVFDRVGHDDPAHQTEWALARFLDIDPEAARPLAHTISHAA